MAVEIPRAFLSHSSDDKQFVSSVANRLGRHRVVFDSMHFKTGYDFISEIEKYVDSSGVFIFFASPKSLSSFWCSFEVDAARLALIRRLVKRSVTYVISNRVNLADIPEWLRQSKINFLPSVGQVVRDIDHHLMSLLPQELKIPFVGRNALKVKFLEDLVDPRKRQVFVFSGLEAIGRRSYAKNVLEENLALQPGPTLNFDHLVGLEELHAQLLTDAEAHTPESLKSELEEFASLDLDQQLAEVVSKLNIATGQNEYAVFLDHGGLTEKTGVFAEPFGRLIDRYVLGSGETRYLVLVHRGKPYFQDTSFNNVCLHQPIPPLTRAESVGLLRRLLADPKNNVDETKLKECAEISEGYPPSLFFVSRFVQKYGLETLLRSPDVVAALKRRVFVRFLRELALDDQSVIVLRYLVREGALEFSVIAAALGMKEDILASSLLKLVDLSLVNYEAPHYSISWPIRDSVERVWGELPSGAYEQIAERLGKWATAHGDIPDIDTIDAIITAQIRGGAAFDWSDNVLPLLPSSMVKVCERCYHQREYEKAYELSLRAVDLSKTRTQKLTALSIRAKALINLQRWSEAEDVIDRLDKEIARERFYLRGFMLRKRRRFADALIEYEKAIATGHNPNSVLRDSADCLFRLGRFDEAISRIKIVRERDRDNPWVLDLLVRCYTDAKDDSGFEEAIADLKSCDTEGRFWKHRTAVFLAKRGDNAGAMALAESACTIAQPPFECFALRAGIAIDLKDFAKAREYLDGIKAKFRNAFSDAQYSLWCKFHLAQNKWEEAESFWAKLVDKDQPEYRGLRIKVLEAKAQDGRVTLKERHSAKKEADQLRREGRFSDFALPEDIDEIE